VTIRLATLGSVSIPSRRVGDASKHFEAAPAKEVSIPSRRVGDREGRGRQHGGVTLFPSPQGGSETAQRWSAGALRGAVSIPSRRVGDGTTLERWRLEGRSFHPLKAGRRLANVA